MAGSPHDNTAPNPTAPATRPMQYMEYPSNLGNSTGGRGGNNSGIENWIAFEAFDFKSSRPVFEIALYIPGDALNTSYKSEYESVNLGGLGAQTDKAIRAMGQNGGMSIDTLKGVLSAQGSAAASEGTTVGMLKAGERANLMVEGTKTVMERAQGAVLNPYTVAAYKGPTDMRTHEFSFAMHPQDAGESDSCVRIVNAFKKAMLPSHGGGSNMTAPSMLFSYPDTFTITYYVNGEALPHTGSNPMFNIGKSVLTGCDLDFTTESVPLFFDGTQKPVSISMKLSFMELEVMYRERIDQGA